MKNFTHNDHIAYLNKKGDILRKIILQLSDEELLKVVPAPGKRIIKQIKTKTTRLAGIISSRN